MAGLNGVHIEFDQAQLQIILDELTNDPLGIGYVSMGIGEKVASLNSPTVQNNPNPQGNIPSPPVETGKIFRLPGWTEAIFVALTDDKKGSLAWRTLMGLDTVDLNSDLAKSMLTDLVSRGLIPQSLAQSMQALAVMPDPNWQAEIIGPSRCEVLLGIGYAVEGSDIR